LKEKRDIANLNKNYQLKSTSSTVFFSERDLAINNELFSKSFSTTKNDQIKNQPKMSCGNFEAY